MNIEIIKIIFTTIQIIGWAELAILFVLLPFENKHEYIYRFGNLIPNNFFAAVSFVIIIATPIMLAGIFACLTYFVFFFVFWLVVK